MKKIIKLTENDLTNIVRKVLNENLLTESISSIDFNTLWQNFPGDASAEDIFPKILPKTYEKNPESFSNACATRMSLALNNVGIKPTTQYKTEKEFVWNGVKYQKGIPLTVRATSMKDYLTSKLGSPTFTMSNDDENEVKKKLAGRNAVFVITNVPGWSATGHVDIAASAGGKTRCGNFCHFGEGGKIFFWVFPGSMDVRALYKNINFHYPDDAIEYLTLIGKDRAKLMSMDEEFVIAWANADKDQKPNFPYKGKVHSSKTGKVERFGGLPNGAIRHAGWPYLNQN